MEAHLFGENKGISQNLSTVRTPQQNGVAERRNRKLETQFWAEVVNTTCFTQNRSLIVKSFKKTNYELFHGRNPSSSFLHIFSCNCFILNNRGNLGKFNPKAFHVFNKRRQTIEESNHVSFNESRSANLNSYTENEVINQWPNSYFYVPNTPIANTAPLESIPDGFVEQTSIPHDHLR